jgi:hypothetical protein
MFMDADLVFSDAQAVTATAASTSYYDTGPLYSGNTGRNLGVSNEIYISTTVDVAMTDSGSDSTITVTLETDDNTSFSSAATVATLFTIPAVTPAGSKFFARVPIAGTVPFERYLQIKYTATGGNLTTGSFTTAIVKNIDNWTSYASAVTTGV